MVVGVAGARSPAGGKRPWTFYVLGTLFVVFMLFLYGPMLVIYLLSFQGPDGGVTFPMRGFSTVWFGGILESDKIGDIPSAFWRSIALASVVSPLTVIISVAAGLGFRRRFPGAGVLFYLAIASLVMPSLLVGFGIALSFHFLGIETGLFTSALAAQMTWTLPHGLLTMFAVIGRFNRSWEEAAADLGASAWQRIRFVVLPILLPGIIGVAMGGFTLSYDEYARTTLTAGSHNTLPMEIFALTTNDTSPTLFAIGTVTTIVSFAVIAFTLWTILRIRRRRGTMLHVAG
jgi:putative spermidine/putrescine transport system permease protein